MERNNKGRFVIGHKVNKKSINALIENNYKSKRFLGGKHTKEAKEKIGKASKGNKYAVGNKPNKTSFKKGHKTWNKNKPLSEQHKKQLSESLKGNIPWNKGTNLSGMLGKHHSKESKIKSSDSNKNKPKKKGKEHYNWKGGEVSRRRGHEWKLIRKQVLIRFDFKCANCGKMTNLDIHHKISYRICKEHKLENLIPLCKSCHMKEEARNH